MEAYGLFMGEGCRFRPLLPEMSPHASRDKREHSAYNSCPFHGKDKEESPWKVKTFLGAPC